MLQAVFLFLPCAVGNPCDSYGEQSSDNDEDQQGQTEITERVRRLPVVKPPVVRYRYHRSHLLESCHDAKQRQHDREQNAANDHR